MWKYEVNVDWKEGKIGTAGSPGKPSFEVATPPEFGGPEKIWTPEDLLAASAASCLMTSALFFIQRAKIELESYRSRAVATMEKTPSGLRITAIRIEVTVALKDAGQEEAMKKALEMAEKSCPISAALNCPVTAELSFG